MIQKFDKISFRELNDAFSRELIKGHKTHDGCEVHFNGFNNVLADADNNFYFFGAVTTLDKEQSAIRQKGLCEKYRKLAPYAKGIHEYILLMPGGQVNVLASSFSHQEGKSVTILEVVTSDFTLADMKQIFTIIRKAIEKNFRASCCPEFDYCDYGAKFTCISHANQDNDDIDPYDYF